jgi:Protein of unknown function (DUF3558)
VRHTAPLIAVVAACAIALVGCSSETPGEANPGDSTDGGSVPSFEETGSTETPTEPSEDPGSGTGDLEPCELLSAQDASALGLPGQGEESDVVSSRGCQWQTSGSHTVTIGLFEDAGIGDVVSDTSPKPLTVGSHDAVEYTGGGTCGVAIAVTDSSRVDVLGTAGGDLTRACQVANQAAELVEPKLP